MANDINLIVGVVPDKAQIQAVSTNIRRQFESSIPDLKLRNVNTSAVNTSLGRTRRVFSQLTEDVDDLGDSLDRGLRRIIALSAGSAALFGIVRIFQNILQSSRDIEKSLTNLNVVLNLPTEQLDSFGKSLFNIARGTAQSFEEVQRSATEFARQGLSVEDTLKRTQAALLLVNLAGIDSIKATEAITAAINSFSNENLKAIDIVNKLIAVDANFAISSADLAEAISRVGSTAQDSGVSFDKLISTVTGAQQVTQRGGSVIGNALKTIFQRLQREDTLNSLQALGVQVREVDSTTGDLTGRLISADRVLRQIGERFKTTGDAAKDLTQEQKAQVSELVAGVNQGNIFRGILAGLSVEQQAYTISINATDEAIRRNAVLLDTQDARIKSLSTSLKEAGANIGKVGFSDFINQALKGLTGQEGGSIGASIIGSIIKNLSGKGEGVGQEFANVFIKGFAGVLTGPGLVAFTVIAAKIAQSLFRVLKNSLGSLRLFGDAEVIVQREIDTSLKSQLITVGNISKSTNDRITKDSATLAVNKGITEELKAQVILKKQVEAPGLPIRPSALPRIVRSRPNFNSINPVPPLFERGSGLSSVTKVTPFPKFDEFGLPFINPLLRGLGGPRRKPAVIPRTAIPPLPPPLIPKLGFNQIFSPGFKIAQELDEFGNPLENPFLRGSGGPRPRRKRARRVVPPLAESNLSFFDEPNLLNEPGARLVRNTPVATAAPVDFPRFVEPARRNIRERLGSGFRRFTGGSGATVATIATPFIAEGLSSVSTGALGFGRDDISKQRIQRGFSEGGQGVAAGLAITALSPLFGPAAPIVAGIGLLTAATLGTTAAFKNFNDSQEDIARRFENAAKETQGRIQGITTTTAGIQNLRNLIESGASRANVQTAQRDLLAQIGNISSPALRQSLREQVLQLDFSPEALLRIERLTTGAVQTEGRNLTLDKSSIDSLGIQLTKGFELGSKGGLQTREGIDTTVQSSLLALQRERLVTTDPRQSAENIKQEIGALSNTSKAIQTFVDLQALSGFSFEGRAVTAGTGISQERESLVNSIRDVLTRGGGQISQDTQKQIGILESRFSTSGQVENALSILGGTIDSLLQVTPELKTEIDGLAESEAEYKKILFDRKNILKLISDAEISFAKETQKQRLGVLQSGFKTRESISFRQSLGASSGEIAQLEFESAIKNANTENLSQQREQAQQFATQINTLILGNRQLVQGLPGFKGASGTQIFDLVNSLNNAQNLDEFQNLISGLISGASSLTGFNSEQERFINNINELSNSVNKTNIGLKGEIELKEKTLRLDRTSQQNAASRRLFTQEGAGIREGISRISRTIPESIDFSSFDANQRLRNNEQLLKDTTELANVFKNAGVEIPEGINNIIGKLGERIAVDSSQFFNDRLREISSRNPLLGDLVTPFQQVRTSFERQQEVQGLEPQFRERINTENLSSEVVNRALDILNTQKDFQPRLEQFTNKFGELATRTVRDKNFDDALTQAINELKDTQKGINKPLDDLTQLEKASTSFQQTAETLNNGLLTQQLSQINANGINLSIADSPLNIVSKIIIDTENSQLVQSIQNTLTEGFNTILQSDSVKNILTNTILQGIVGERIRNLENKTGNVQPPRANQ
jgi:TP901 family phage tail tape measure protein